MASIARQLSQVPPLWMNIIIAAIGLIFLLVGAPLSDADYSTCKNILLGLGTSFVSSAGVAYLTSHYLLAQNVAMTFVDDWKLHGLHRTRAEANAFTNPLLEIATELDVHAFGLRGFRDRHAPLIEARVKKGLKMRILVLEPESVFVTARTQAEKLKDGQIKKEIVDLINWCKQLQQAAPVSENIQLRIYDSPYFDFYFRLDNFILIGPYLHGKTSQQSPTYSFNSGGTGFEFWKGHFAELWNDPEFCRDALSRNSE